MSKEEKDIFDKLFQDEFRSHTEKVEEENWDIISARLAKKRFFKFNPSRFNVYYLSAIVFAGLLIGLFLFNSEEKTKELNKEQNILQPPQELSVSDSTTVQEPSVLKKRTTDKLVSPKKIQKNSQGKEVKAIKIDSASTAPVVPPTEELKRPVKEIPKAKEYFVYEQDTIVEQDTINVKRRKKRK